MITLNGFRCIYVSFSEMLLTTFLRNALFVTVALTEHRLPRNLAQMITLTMSTLNGFHCTYEIFFSNVAFNIFDDQLLLRWGPIN